MRAWVKEGYGMLVMDEGNSYYIGMWHADQPHGFGKLMYDKEKGQFYEGNWIEGYWHDYGKYCHSDGSEFSGKWTNGNMIKDGLNLK